MPSIETLLVFLIAILVLWIVLKVAKVALKLIFFFVSIAILAGVLWYLFMR